jgi:hypothetical protein
MHRYFWMFLLVVPAVAVTAPQKVRPIFDREPFVAEAVEASPATDGVCEVSIVAPRGVVIETVSYRAVTAPFASHPTGFGDYSAFEREAVLQVTTGGVTADFHFATDDRTYVWRSQPMVSPFSLSTAFSNTLSARLYPDEESSIDLAFRVNDSDYSHLPELESCTLSLSGYRVHWVRSGLGP